MWINLKRFALGAVLLASLALLLQGCGSSSGPPTTYNDHVSKLISGTVSDLTTNLPLPGATIVAYSISNGVPTTAQALGGPVNSASDGSYALHIPTSYKGSVLVKATAPPAKLFDRLAKVLSLSYTSNTIRAVIPDAMVARNPIQPVMLNFASEALVVFIEANIVNSVTPPGGFTKTGFSSDNIQKAIIVLESFFGPHFTQFSLPKNTFDTNSSIAQQDLLVSITALNIVLTNNTSLTLADILTKLVATGGLGTLADDIKSAIVTAAAALIQAGTLPPEYVPNPAIFSALSNAQTIPVPTSSLSDTSAPTQPSGLTTVPLNPRAVRLAWAASTDNSGNVDGYALYRTDPSGIILLIDYVRNALTYTDSTASPATAYTYVVVAYDATRNYSDASNAAPVTTFPLAIPGDTTPPTRPAGLVCKGFTDTQVNIQWVQSTKTNRDGSVVPASGYYVYRNSQIIATVLESTYIDNNVLPATEYTYYIKAFDSNANVSAASTPLSIRTLSLTGSTPPAAPTNLALVSAAYNKVALNWNISPTPNVTYNVYRGSALTATGITPNQFSDSTVVPNSTYLYTVTAANSTGESSHSTPLTVVVPVSPNTDQTAPSVPQNFALVTAATSNSVALTWAASTKTDGDKIVAGYDILRGDSTGNNFIVIATVITPGYTDTSVAPSTTYTYQVKSYSTTGTRSVASATLTVVTAALVNVADTTPPTAPTGLKLNSAATSNAVALTWTASTKSTGDKVVAGYKVYRNGLQIADVAGIGFIDTTLTASTTYTYTVKAYDNPGNVSAPSNELVVTTPAPTPGFYTLSGKVAFNGIGLPGVTLTLIGTGSGIAITDPNGNYSFTNVINGNFSISALRTGYLFAPDARSVLVNSASVTSLDFTAALPEALTGGVVFPTGSITGGITYPPGTIIGGITYPSGTVIGGVTYPTSTVIGGVTYPTGTVIGGITYPDGVVIGGVTYPPGTVVGGIAFPPGTVIGGVIYPTGVVIGGVTYPTGTVSGGVIYPSGTAIGTVTYPTGTVIGTVTYPTGRVTGGVTFPTGTVTGMLSYPTGTIIGGITYPSGTVIGGVTYPTSTVIGGVTYPTGTVIGGITYPNGVVIGGISYPPGTVVGGIAFPPGTVISGVTYPTGTVIGGVTYPTGTVTGGVIYPTGTAIGVVTYPTGTVIGGATYPSGMVIGGVTYPSSVLTGGITYTTGAVSGSVLFPSEVVTGTVSYLDAAVTPTLVFN